MKARYVCSSFVIGAGVTLLARGTRGQLEHDLRAGGLIDGHPAAEGARALGEHVEELASPLLGTVVGDRRHEAAVGCALDGDTDLLRRASPHRAVQCLADDLIERGLHLLAELLR